MIVIGRILLCLAVVTILALPTVNCYSVDVYYDPSIGDYLVDENGMTLYYFNNDDNENEASNCYGRCAETWMPFYVEVESMYLPDRLSIYDFFTTRRADGEFQTTYKGWPLYLYINDINAGDINGQGIDYAWYAMRP